MRMFIPESAFGTTGCDYGQPGCATYLYLYSEYGTEVAANDGFEEWSLAGEPIVLVSKSVETDFDREFIWDISKTVSPDQWDLLDGGSGTSQYTVTVTKSSSVDSNWTASGLITPW